MSSKTCKWCHTTKPLSDFYRNKVKYYEPMCKKCRKGQSTRWRMEHRHDACEHSRTYYQRNKQKRLDYQQEYKKKHPERYRCHYLALSAVRSGKLKRKEFCSCGANATMHMHHDDYSKPLDVRFVCAVCHAKITMENKNGTRFQGSMDTQRDMAEYRTDVEREGGPGGD